MEEDGRIADPGGAGAGAESRHARQARESAAAGHASYPPIEDYGLIGDTRSTALISREGSIEWLCWPHFSSSSVFAAILDRRNGGHFRIGPAGPFEVERAYVPETNVLETRFITPEGVAKLIDCMPIYERAGRKRLEPQRELLRVVECERGSIELEVDYAPRPDYGRRQPRLCPRGKLGWACPSGRELFLLQTDAELERQPEQRLFGRVRLRAGERRHFAITYALGDAGVAVPVGHEADERIDETVRWWRSWSAELRYEGPHRDEVLRSALVLKLLTYTVSGAIIAAPTASLPEVMGGPENWDYRYCWLRDTAITLRAFMDLGFPGEGKAFLGWLLHATRLTWPKLQVLYDVYGETRVHETELDHFEGYRGSRPVRIGNGAWDQRQLDVYGELLIAAHEFVRRGGELDRSETRMLRGLGRTVCNEWHLPDQGIWEVRTAPRHHTFSKVMCWAALDRLLRLTEMGVLRLRRGERRRVERERERIREDVEIHAYNEAIGSYVGVYDSEQIDASLLLLPRIRYQDASHPRMQATFETIRRQLGRGEALLHRVREYESRQPPPEGCFGICSFWAVDFLARSGRCDEARRRFDRLLRYASDLGLYGEEIDPDSGAAMGNFPQAFTHAGLIAAALALVDYCPPSEKQE